jgi:hypothetical protein
MEPLRSAAPTNRSLNWLLGLTALVSAWLLFQIQPMVAKRILPWFGGGTAIWTTAMLFFQTALFAGYLYAHVLVRSLAPARQAAVHMTLVASAALLAVLVGVIPGDLWKPSGGGPPVLQILTLLAACVGLPYLMLAATAPLVQVWFARANPGRTPYRLYALSNVGSLAALVSYPFLIEPRLGVLRQGAAWSYVYLGFAALCIGSALLALRASPAAADDAPPPVPTPTAPARPPALEWFFWLALPASASVALLAITAYLCQDVASIPLLWIAPMVIYLLSFILTFDSDRWYRRWFWGPLLAVATFVNFIVWGRTNSLSLTFQLVSLLGLLLVIAMICHGELARMRPTADRLTAYYLAISGGGALGGLLTGVVAPVVFPDYYELPVVVPVVWLLGLGVLVTDRSSPFFDGRNMLWLAGMGLLFVGVVGGTINYFVHREESSIARARNFYGAIRVREFGDAQTPMSYRQLTHGRISHGAQFLRPDERHIPSQYYGPASGISLLLADAPAVPRRVGVVGLGVGTISAFAQAGDEYRFYEINPQVMDFAERYFTFLADARDRGAKVSLIFGDARLQLEREPPQQFDVLALDAFSSDSIPAHLLTLEAFDVYLRHLAKPDGVLAMHISNRYLRLGIVVHAAVKRRKLDARLVYALADESTIGSDSVWILAFRPDASIAARDIGMAAATTGPNVMPDILWTDDYNNVVDLLTSSTFEAD